MEKRLRFQSRRYRQFWIETACIYEKSPKQGDFSLWISPYAVIENSDIITSNSRTRGQIMSRLDEVTLRLAWKAFEMSIVSDNCPDPAAVKRQRKLFREYQDLQRAIEKARSVDLAA